MQVFLFVFAVRLAFFAGLKFHLQVLAVKPCIFLAFFQYFASASYIFAGCFSASQEYFRKIRTEKAAQLFSDVFGHLFVLAFAKT